MKVNNDWINCEIRSYDLWYYSKVLKTVNVTTKTTP